MEAPFTTGDVKLMKDFWFNPNQTMNALGVKHEISAHRAGALVSRLIKLKKDERQKLFFGETKELVK